MNIPLEEQLAIVQQRWVTICGNPPNAINLFHGSPLIPPHSVVREKLKWIANYAILWDAVGQSRDRRETYGSGIDLHSYREPGLMSPELAVAAIQEFRKDGIPVNEDADEVTVGVGTTQLATSLFWAFAAKGRKILIPTPTYSAFLLSSQIVRSALKESIVLLSSDHENNGRITAGMIEEGMQTNPDAKAIFLINPVNPTGEVIRREELESIASVAKKHDLIIIMDEIYKDMILEENASFTAIASLEVEGEQIYDRTITLRGVSKSFGLAKLRIGIACTATELKRKLHTSGFIWMNTAAPSEIDQLVAAAAFAETPLEYHQYVISTYKMLRDLVIDRINLLNQKINGLFGTEKVLYIGANKPEAGFFIIIEAPGLYNCETPDGTIILMDFDLSSYLTQNGVAVLAGSVFCFAEQDMKFRVTYSVPKDVLEEGLCLMESAIMRIVEHERVRRVKRGIYNGQQ